MSDMDAYASGLADRLNGLLEHVDRIGGIDVNQRPKRRIHGVPEAYDADDWPLHAACRGSHDPAFWPDIDTHPGLIRREMIRRAKAICNACAVRARCRDFALETIQPYGIWGGLTAEERRRIRTGS